MNINIANAASLFFPNPSLEMVYFEAIANSIDAGATLIQLEISIKSFSSNDTFIVQITDNGQGFNDKNFEKFSSLLEVEEEDHKGVGRLVYLKYFKDIDIKSVFEDKKREFSFNNKFKGTSEISKWSNKENETILRFSGYKLDRIKSYDFLKPKEIKKSIMMHFFPLLYNKKRLKEELKIIIKLETSEPNLKHGFYSTSQIINVEEIANLEEEIIEAPELDLFEKLNLYYSVKENSSENSIITAICVDGRTIPIDIISKGGVPSGYEIVFLMYSNLFRGKVNSSRQELTLKEEELKIVKKIFSERVIQIFNNEIPQINDRNNNAKFKLEERFPHLQGYFNDKVVGLIDKNQALEVAQKKFFNDQKEILEASTLSNEQYEKSLEISSRVLTEYVLYRNLIINKLKQVDKKSSESDIHSIIIPMRKSFSKDNFHNDLFTNNAWLLDDKYMSYSTILSDLKMTELLRNLSIDDDAISNDESRPDIAIVFSNDPNTAQKVDVVIVELKKTDLKLAKKEEVVSQLRQRARKLLKYYGDKIQRIWFYGIVDFDSEFKISLLEDKYTRLYSNDSVFYKEHPIILDENKPNDSIPVGLYVMSFEAFIEDAASRNATFLNLLKENLKQITD